ncbi:MAG TPA: hemerythrin domain-containing protein [Stellaceae bacterium]|nr:hemerythrin domain-containing protein [Stellaceae bacterium]
MPIKSVAQWISPRDAMAFGAGALLALAASRIAPPVAGRAVGSLRAMAGTDPFAALAQDHKKVLALFAAIEETDEASVARRAAMLFQVKRMLTAHALAEEDIVYPMLHDDAQRRDEAKKLYREHADIKLRLFELEHKPKDDPNWIAELRALHRIVEEHTRDEEETEFPKLRAAINQAQCTTLLGEVSREKSMLL